MSEIRSLEILSQLSVKNKPKLTWRRDKRDDGSLRCNRVTVYNVANPLHDGGRDKKEQKCVCACNCIMCLRQYRDESENKLLKNLCRVSVAVCRRLVFSALLHGCQPVNDVCFERWSRRYRTWCVWDKQQLLNLHPSLDGNWHYEGIMWDLATVLATDLTKKTDVLQRLVGGPRPRHIPFCCASTFCFLFLARDAFIRKNHRTIAMTFVCLSVSLGRACIVIIPRAYENHKIKRFLNNGITEIVVKSENSCVHWFFKSVTFCIYLYQQQLFRMQLKDWRAWMNTAISSRCSCGYTVLRLRPLCGLLKVMVGLSLIHISEPTRPY